MLLIDRCREVHLWSANNQSLIKQPLFPGDIRDATRRVVEDPTPGANLITTYSYDLLIGFEENPQHH
jgi:hypothetical protein